MLASGATAIQADDVGVAPTKYVVVDKQAVGAGARVVFVSRDRAAGIAKGSGTNLSDISVTFRTRYDTETGAYTLPAGRRSARDGWRANEPNLAKFVNRNAPGGSTNAKLAVIKPGKLLKLVGKGPGDAEPIDIVAAGAPNGSVGYAPPDGPCARRRRSRFPARAAGRRTG
jgi:hypothetical protein